MCLSTVVKRGDAGEETLASEVRNVVMNPDGTLLFTDLLGEEIIVKGTITEIDLLDGRIYVK